jgi:hypothetical protein
MTLALCRVHPRTPSAAPACPGLPLGRLRATSCLHTGQPAPVRLEPAGEARGATWASQRTGRSPGPPRAGAERLGPARAFLLLDPRQEVSSS